MVSLRLKNARDTWDASLELWERAELELNRAKVELERAILTRDAAKADSTAKAAAWVIATNLED